jgi:DNA-binding response OmpR family regulator
VPQARPAPQGRETILLAEDELLVRKALSAALSRAGYTVVEAVDGEDAVRQFRAHRESIALCVLDVMMPRLNGREVYEAVTALRPGTRVLFASGYTADVLEARGFTGPVPSVIAKPVTPAALLLRVREVLDGSA